VKKKTAICTCCMEELEYTERNFYRSNRSSARLRARCIACDIRIRENRGFLERLPSIKVKAANILFACGYDYAYIASDMGVSERAVRNSVSAERRKAVAA